MCRRTEMLIIWGSPFSEIYGDPICKGCGESLIGLVVQHTLFKCPICDKVYEMHSACAQRGCPKCGNTLVAQSFDRVIY